MKKIMSVKLLSIITSVALVATMGIFTTFALQDKTEGQNQDTQSQSTSVDEKRPDRRPEDPDFEKMIEKWNQLSDQQKAEVYSLDSNVQNAQSAMIDKYAELGLIDKDKADKMKTEMSEHVSKIKEEGKMPMICCGGHKHHKHPPRDEDRPIFDKESLTDEQKQRMKTEFEHKIQQDIANGKISQDKANEMLNDFNNN